MNINTIESLFTLFSGETDIFKYSPLIDNAPAELIPFLKDDADMNDPRLNYVCAAIANYRYQQITAGRDKIAYTDAGTLAKTHNGKQQFDLALSLKKAYLSSISDLLKDKNFAVKAKA